MSRGETEHFMTRGQNRLILKGVVVKVDIFKADTTIALNVNEKTVSLKGRQESLSLRSIHSIKPNLTYPLPLVLPGAAMSTYMLKTAVKKWCSP